MDNKGKNSAPSSSRKAEAGAPPSYDESQELELSKEEEAMLVEAMQWIPRGPTEAEAHAPRLQKPVVIPRIDVGSPLRIPLPFVRAYSPDLQAHGISALEFVTFIDNLAIAQAAPVPLQALKLAGDMVGFVPWHWAGLTGAGISIAAGVSTAAVSIIRTRAFFKKMNAEFFHPRGLKAATCKYKDLAARLGISSSSGDEGDRDNGALELGPLDPRSPESLSLRHRVMQGLAPHIAPLTLDVPPAAGPRNIIDKMSAKQIERQISKKERKTAKRAGKFAEKVEKRQDKIQRRTERLEEMGEGSQRAAGGREDDGDSDSDSSDDSESDSELEEQLKKLQASSEGVPQGTARDKDVAKVDETRSREERKADRKRRKLLRKREKRAAKLDRKIGKKGAKDLKKASRMEFVVVESL